MSVALFIHSFPGANEIVRRHWPYYKKSGWPVFGVGRTNGNCQWPEKIPVRNIGEDSYISGDNLCRRLVDTFRWFRTDKRFTGFTHACVIEYDCIFLAPIQVFSAAGHLAGFKREPMKAMKYYHCPWMLDWQIADMFIAQADILIRRGDVEYGNPDFFFGYVLQSIGIQISHFPESYSRNTIDNGFMTEEAVGLAKSGKIKVLHGVKTKKCFDLLTQ